MPESLFTEIRIPQQKTYDNTVLFPTVLSPNPNTVPDPFNVSLVVEAIRAHKPWLDTLLHKTGAILLRGFPVTTASHFNDFVEAFGFDEMPYDGGAASRTNVVGRIFTANESPPDKKIPFHHEMALLAEFPTKLFLFCEVEPQSGGETPIVLSHIIYEKMKERYPEFVERLEEHGVIYTRVLEENDDPSFPLGRGWKSTFLTKDKSVAEERAAKQNRKLEWMEDGSVKTILGPIPAIKVDKSRQRKIWFNNIVPAHVCKDAGYKPATFGDGQPLPADIVDDCQKILDEECIAIPWQKGDVLMLDNLAVLHSRQSSDPSRRILASLCKAAKQNMKLEWMEDGSVKTITGGPIPAIKVDKSRQRRIWFNSIVPAFHKEDAGNNPIMATYGDRQPLPADCGMHK